MRDVKGVGALEGKGIEEVTGASKWSRIFIVFDYIIAFFVTMLTAGAWFFDRNLSISLFENILVLELLLALYLFLHYVIIHKFYWSKHSMIRVAFVLGMMLLYYSGCRLSRDFFLNRYFVLVVLFYLWFISHSDPKCVWKRITNIVFVLACCALVLYVLGSLLNVIPEWDSAERVWGGWKPDIIRNFYYLYYESHQITVGDHIIMRNGGAFAECPMYNFVLCVAIGTELFLSKKVSKIKIIILILSVLTTFSTTGLIFIIMAFVAYILIHFDEYPKLAKYKSKIKYFVLIAFLLFVAVILLKTISPDGKGSMDVRTDHLMSCLKTVLEYPLFGCGWGNGTQILKNAYFVQGLSVGLLSFMAYGGMILTSVIVVPFVINVKKSFISKKYNKVVFEALFIVLFFFTIVNPYPILWLFIVFMTIDEENTDRISFENADNIACKLVDLACLLCVVILVAAVGWFRYHSQKGFAYVDINESEYDNSADIRYFVDAVEMSTFAAGDYRNRVFINGWLIIKGEESSNVSVEVLLKDNQTGDYYLLSTMKKRRTDITENYSLEEEGINYDSSGFAAYDRIDDLVSEENYSYTIYLRVECNGKLYLVETPDQVLSE